MTPETAPAPILAGSFSIPLERSGGTEVRFADRNPEVEPLRLTPVGRIRYTVAPGDTLSDIAEEYGVSVSDLRRWNNLRGDTIQIGQELTIRTSGSSGERVQDEVTVRSGDTGLSIARRNGITLRELERWNPDVDIDRLRVGQRLVIYVDGGSEGARGTPNRGRLSGGVQLESGPGWIVRNPDRAWGTRQTVDAIRLALARVDAHFLLQPDLAVGDLSFARGGPMSPHESHQNGMDVDISYYRTDCEEVCEWREIAPDELDVQHTWYLFQSWLDQGLVEYIFMDWSLQGPLYEYARSRGASDEQLAAWFQYPSHDRSGIIRHETGHDDHFHVRFVQDE